MPSELPLSTHLPTWEGWTAELGAGIWFVVPPTGFEPTPVDLSIFETLCINHLTHHSDHPPTHKGLMSENPADLLLLQSSSLINIGNHSMIFQGKLLIKAVSKYDINIIKLQVLIETIRMIHILLRFKNRERN